MRYLVDTNLISKQENNPKARNWVIQHYLQLAVCSISMQAGGFVETPKKRLLYRFVSLRQLVPVGRLHIRGAIQRSFQLLPTALLGALLHVALGLPSGDMAGQG